MQPKKKVVVRLTGRCGNQLFQYAYGRAVAIENNAEVVIHGDCNVSLWRRIQFGQGVYF